MDKRMIVIFNRNPMTAGVEAMQNCCGNHRHSRTKQSGTFASGEICDFLFGPAHIRIVPMCINTGIDTIIKRGIDALPIFKSNGGTAAP